MIFFFANHLICQFDIDTRTIHAVLYNFIDAYGVFGEKREPVQYIIEKKAKQSRVSQLIILHKLTQQSLL